VELTSPFTIEGESFAAFSPILSQSQSSISATSLLSTMSTEDIQLHIASLQNGGIDDDSANPKKLLTLSGRRLAMKCLPIIINLIYHTETGWIFKQPVDPKENCAPDYYDVIRNPMDLGLIRRRLENGFYQNLYSFESDVYLVFDNCILYNGEDSDLGEIAVDLKNRFLLDLQTMLQGKR
jgi:E1A/CREB-binding protein